MSITITEFTADHLEAVVHFNERLRSGGMHTQFPESSVPLWLPPAAGRPVYQEYFVALDDEAVVRGAYILKHQDFKIKDRVVSVGDFGLPISEGTVDRKYSNIASRLLFNAIGRQPLLYGLGMGGYDEAVARLFTAARWLMFTVPFFFKVIHPTRFCRNITTLRRSPPKRIVLDLAAWTGLGWLGVKTVQAIRGKRIAAAASVTVESVDEFGPWADDIWEACGDDYGMIALRSCDVLRVLYPREDPRFIRLKVYEGERLLGWAVMLDTQMSKHKQFGAMRVGSFVDGLASASDAGKVVSAATTHLERQGVDLIVSNQSHAAWCSAFSAAGFLRGPSNFLFGGSRKLAELLKSQGVESDQIYLNRGDGDGPINL